MEGKEKRETSEFKFGRSDISNGAVILTQGVSERPESATLDVR